MTISIYPVPISADFSISGSFPNINITADILSFDLKISAIKSSFPARERDPILDYTFDCKGLDRFNEPGQGILDFATDMGISGLWLNKTIWSEPLEFATSFNSDMKFVLGVVMSSEDIGNNKLEFDLDLTFDFLFEIPKTAFVKWAKTGTMDFIRDKSNRAGEIPMEWAGTVTNLAKLGRSVMAYGGNGVSVMAPSGIFWGITTMHRVGLLGRDAFAGNEFIHFFIDQTYKLFQYDTQLHKLDYSGELSNLSESVVLSYDPRNQLLYICDGTIGFVYSPDSKSLGKGPVNITGIDYQNQTEYAVSPAAIIIPSFEIWTDTQDFGLRHGKNVQSVDFGLDVTETIEAAIRFRNNKSEAFIQTDWYEVDPRGQAFIPCFGYEFQFGLRSSVYSYFELDYITIKGERNAY